MRLWERISLALYAVGFTLVALVVVAASLGQIQPLVWFLAVVEQDLYRWWVGVSGLVVFIFGLRVLVGAVSQPPQTQTTVITTELGDVRITMEALENLVLRAAFMVRGVREVKVRLRLTPGGVAISLRTVVNPETNIPVLTRELQDSVEGYVRSTVGINILETHVLVENVSRENRGRVE